MLVTMTVDIPAGLLLVFGKLGENVSETEFNGTWLLLETTSVMLTDAQIGTTTSTGLHD